MLRSALIGLDGSIYSDVATELGIRWAKKFGTLLVGLGIVDKPSHYQQAGQGSVLLGSIANSEVTTTKHNVDNLVELFSLRCKDADVECRMVEKVCPPTEGILQEAQRYDVIVIGQKTYFHCEKQPEGDHETVADIVKHNPRPVVAVPAALNSGESMVIAYDGSVQAARAVEAFRGSGIWQDEPIHVVSFDRDVDIATHRAEIAADYLRLHGMNPECHAMVTSGGTAAAILAKAEELKANMLVMGAYGQPHLKEFLVGSVTRSALKEATMPLFLYH